MASRYTDEIAYQANIAQVFQQLSNKYGKNPALLNYQEDPVNYSIAFTYPAHMTTHGERVQIQLSAPQEGITVLNIVSASIQKEFDCGNNRTHVEMILYNLNKAFTPIAISAKTKRHQKSDKLVAVIIIAVVLIALVSVVSWIVKNSGGNTGSEWATCHKCDGDGKVENGLGIEVKCPGCDGVGSIYIGD